MTQIFPSDMERTRTMSHLFSRMATRLGWTDGYLTAINDPSHEPLMDIDPLVDALEELRTTGKTLVVYPDIDMDGITAGTLGYAGLAELGFTVHLFTPDISKGHGMRPVDVANIRAQFPDVAAIITCDTGIDAYSGIQAARDAGLDVFVTDHHKEVIDDDSQRVNANIVVNPMRYDETYAHPGICGAFVFYQVIEHYTQKYQPEKLRDIKLLQLFAGMGTVSDVMPVLYENREVIRNSLSILRLLYKQVIKEWPSGEIKVPDINETPLLTLLHHNSNHDPRFVSAFEGAAIILRMHGEIGKISAVTSVNEGFYGFYLAPAFNALRRMEVPIDIAFQVFFGQEPEKAMASIIEINEQRKLSIIEYRDKILSTDQPGAPYVYFTDAPPGMLGLVANTFMANNGLPTIVLAQHPDGTYSGSARSPEWLNYNSALHENGFTVAGHEQAFGIRIDDDAKLQKLMDFTQTIPDIMKQLIASGVTLTSEAPLTIGKTRGCDVRDDQIDVLVELAEIINMIGPYGEGFREPAIDVVVDVRKATFRTMGADKQHMKIVSDGGFPCIIWNTNDDENSIREHARENNTNYVTFTGKLSANTFNGNTTPQIIVTSFE